ncbi:MAG: hypothetical protein U9N72_09420 [Bacteroidota bacterium]|nr:hypothetical protein [Bacteroidota bacterium]
MKTILFKFFILLLLVLPGTLMLFSQETGTPDPSYKILEELDKIHGADQRLVSGPFYHQAHYGSLIGYPFCINEEWKTGQVKLSGITYDNLLLRYDIVSNELVLNTINLNNTPWQISLKTSDISSFKMDNREYVVFPGSQDEDKPVFCELVSSGHVDFLLLTTKELRITVSGGSDYEYKKYYKNYLSKDNTLVRFRGRRSLFKLFPDLRKELRQYISQQGLLLGKKNTSGRALLIDYCNKILSEQK